MTKIIKEYPEIDKGKWRGLLKESRFAGFFQTPECYEFYERQAQFTPFCAAVERGGELACLLVGYIQRDGGKLKSYMSRRAIINGGPLIADGASLDDVTTLLKAVRTLLKGRAIYIETRNFFNYSDYAAAFEVAGFGYEPHLNFQIDTESDAVVQTNMGKSRKRDIKVTLRDGAEIVENPTDDDVRQYYAILDNLYRTKVKTPLFPLEFFLDLNAQPYGHLLLVRYDGRIIGGTVCAGMPGQPLYEWFACGEDGRYKNIHTSTLATYGGIQYAVQNGYPMFDMMGAGKPDDGYGVRDFKAKFGGKLVQDGRYLCILNSFLFHIGSLAVKILKKLK